MLNIQTTRFPGGLSTFPDGNILGGFPLPIFNPNVAFIFDDFWGFDANNDDTWFQSGNNGGGAAGDIINSGAVQLFTAGTVLGDNARVFIPYAAFNVANDSTIYFSGRWSAGTFAVPQTAALGMATLTAVSSGQALSTPVNGIQFEQINATQIDFAVYAGGVEVFRDAAVGSFSAINTMVTCSWKLDNGVISYIVEGGRGGSTPLLPNADATMTPFMHYEVGTGGTQNFGSVDYILASAAVDRGV